MADKFLTLDNTNGLVEKAPATAGGAGAEDRIPVLDGTGRLPATMMPTGIASEQKVGNAFETITANDLVYFKADGTVAKASNASGGHYAQGWAANSGTAGQPITVNFESTISGLVGLTPDAVCYLGAAGAITQTIITGANTLYQEIGLAISATELNFSNSGTRIKRIA